MADLNAFFLPVKVRQTAATAAVATVWTMRNTHATKAVLVKQIILAPFSDAAAPGQIAYELCRFTAATPTGGAALIPIQMRTSSAWVSAITDARVLDTGLTVAGVTFETAFAAISAGGLASGGSPFLLDMTDSLRMFGGLEFLAGEGLAIRLTVVSTIGQGIAGSIFWDERL
jgi:hypothetical protein